jgi:Planctomycete cytochrome C
MHFKLNSPSQIRIGLGLLCVCGLAASSFSAAGRPPKHGYSGVKPIIDAKCASCHNDAQHPENVNLSSYSKLMKSGEHGPIVVPGQPGKSKLLKYVDGEKQPRMPFKQAPLSKREIETIRDWIKSGARP